MKKHIHCVTVVCALLLLSLFTGLRSPDPNINVLDRLTLEEKIAEAKRQAEAEAERLARIEEAKAKAESDAKNAELERQPLVRRLFSFETRIIPYIIVNGGRQYVQATSEGVPGINVRTEYQGGKYYIVLGSKTLPNGAKRVKLTHGRYSAKFWVSSAMFDNNVHEVELK